METACWRCSLIEWLGKAIRAVPQSRVKKHVFVCQKQVSSSSRGVWEMCRLKRFPGEKKLHKPPTGSWNWSCFSHKRIHQHCWQFWKHFVVCTFEYEPSQEKSSYKSVYSENNLWKNRKARYELPLIYHMHHSIVVLDAILQVNNCYNMTKSWSKWSWALPFSLKWCWC